MLRLLLATLLFVGAGPAAAELPFVNWENHPVRALDLSPDGRMLAVAHTADQRVQLFDVSSGEPIAVGSVLVGVDPVAVKFRTDGELWVVNHISDSVSIVDVHARQVRATLATDDEPFDVVFAQGKAFVSCSQANRVLVFDAQNPAAPQRIAINGEDPRALAVSADGASVYVAIFESGNATTVLGGGLESAANGLPNVVSDPRGPYGGVNPPPNAGSVFDPPRDPSATPPRVGLIVRKDGAGRWRDDNGADWTRFVSGEDAALSGRRPGWDLPDRDVALINAGTLEVRYVSGLMNMVMALAVNPASGALSVVGTEAINEVRFEPKVNSRFVRAQLALVDPAPGSAARIGDLNPQLDYALKTLPPAQRLASIGDPRAVVWRGDGQQGWVAGMGSNNVIVIDANGQRVGEPIKVGEGPVGLALDEARGRLYVWNHFEASLSTIDIIEAAERDRLQAFNPLPQAIRAGRPLLYDTQLTSGLGQAACGSCHVDARMDRLAWDLGDPSLPPQRFEQNCLTTLIRRCEDFHAMKGPMTTQTLQDIIGHEPHHWRGDREGIEAFNPAFEGLLGNHRLLTADEMQAFEDFLATVTFPPNPFRTLDNRLPEALSLDGQFTSGRFAMAGQPLGVGNAVRGLQLYTTGFLDPPFQCVSCHTLPTGMAHNGPLLLPQLGLPTGGSVRAHGPLGENRLGIVSVDGSTNISIKVPQLRNQYEKVGFEVSQLENNAGFGFLHDGSVDSIARFLSARLFNVRSDQEVADLVALMMAFSGSEFPAPLIGTPPPGPAAPPSLDTHAAVGHQFTLGFGDTPASFQTLINLARDRKIDLIVSASQTSYVFDAALDRMLSDDGSAPLQTGELRGRATNEARQTWTAVPAGLGRRLAIDRDGDGIGNRVEIQQGSSPADALSTGLRPATGLWFNPDRSGHGLNVERVGDALAVTWYTYDDAGEPSWYLAVAPFSNPWRAELSRYVWNPQRGAADASVVGELRMDFATAKRAQFAWQLGNRTGSEPMQTLFENAAPAAPERSGVWFDPAEPGWGLALYTAGDLFSAGLYFYDAANQPRWVLGVGSNQNEINLDMQSFRGSCPDCAFAAPQVADGGTVQLTFAGGRVGTVQTHAIHSAASTAPWRRGPVAIAPLSDPPRFPGRE